MLPLELAGLWLGAGLVTWDRGLLLLGVPELDTELRDSRSGVAKTSSRSPRSSREFLRESLSAWLLEDPDLLWSEDLLDDPS